MLAALVLSLASVDAAVAGGGYLPATPPGSLTTTNMTAVVVLDPNGPVPFNTGGANANGVGPAPATPTGTIGSIELTNPGVGTSAATFQVSGSTTLGDLKYGCNLALNQSRFIASVGFPIGGPSPDGISDPFANWLPSSVTAKLFKDVGVTLVSGGTVKVPGVAAILSASCESFPKKPGDDLAFAEIMGKVKAGTPAPYPDLSANSDAVATWGSGFLVLKLQIGLWQ